MSSSTGVLFRVTTFGESHGGAVGCVIDGCIPGISIDLRRVQGELDRRRPGQSHLTTARSETDTVQCLSGLENGVTLGTPIALVVPNKDADPSAYASLRDVYRPSHADFVYDAKYGVRASSGGGRASARETVGRVAAGAVARQVLEFLGSVEVVAWVDRVKDVSASVDSSTVSTTDVERNAVRCPDPDAAARMEEVILAAKEAGDTVGGVIRCVIRGVPAGLGAPVFDKLEAELGKAMLSLPATKGFEIGSGFAGTYLSGIEHNDAFIPGNDGGVATATNRSGGIQGGISNGMPIEFAVAFKPVSTVFVEQATVAASGESTTVQPRGRHDPCVLPRAVAIVEAMACLVLVDHWLRQRAIRP